MEIVVKAATFLPVSDHNTNCVFASAPTTFQYPSVIERHWPEVGLSFDRFCNRQQGRQCAVIQFSL
jgi:hypothetical protein